MDGTMNAQKTFCRCCWFEALHLALARARHLMRILRPIVFLADPAHGGRKSEMPEGSAVRTQLVGRHRGRREALPAEQLAHQLDGRRPVSTTLVQVEDLALVVDGTPQIHLLQIRCAANHLAERAVSAQ